MNVAFTLPPPLPPQAGTLDVIREQAERASFAFRGYRFHLLGDRSLPDPQLQKALVGCRTPDDVIAALARAFYGEGQLGAQLVHARSGKDVYVLVVIQPIAAVRGPEVLLPFFADVTHSDDSELMPRVLLADLYTERARLDGQAKLLQSERGHVLDLNATELDLSPARFGVEFSNPGNRFVGREFVDVDARYDNRYGDRFSVQWRSSLKRWYDDNADRYDEVALGANRVTPYGVFGIGAHQREYRTPDDPVVLKGTLRDGELSWLYPLAASLGRRWISNVRVQYIHDEQRIGDEPGVREAFPTVQAGIRYMRNIDRGGGMWKSDVGLSLRKGLGGDRHDTTNDLSFLAWSPTLAITYDFDPKLSLSWNTLSQYATTNVPQQAQWVLGGANSLVAYLPGVAIGDSGLNSAVTLQYETAEFADFRLQFRLFGEYGNARFDGEETVSLADLGAEIILRWRKTLRASIASAVPIADRNIDRQQRKDAEANLVFSLKASF